jgi:peptidoglycan/LPS O-acetylase OafA/YrhL
MMIAVTNDQISSASSSQPVGDNASPAAFVSSHKFTALDGVRGIAILAVFLHHNAWRIAPTNKFQIILSGLMTLGWSGVDLFFVLSGFLITGILLDSRRAKNYFLSFYVRRALRIFPLYYAFLLIAFALFPSLVASDWLPVAGDRWIYFCYLTNWLALWKGPWRHSVLAHLWSLAVEEQFYLCWPLLVWMLRPTMLFSALLVGEGSLIGGRIWWLLVHGPSQAVANLRMDGLLLGAVCALIVRRPHLPKHFGRWIPWISAASFTSFLVLASKFKNSELLIQAAGFPLLAFCF